MVELTKIALRTKDKGQRQEWEGAPVAVSPTTITSFKLAAMPAAVVASLVAIVIVTTGVKMALQVVCKYNQTH